MFPLNSVLSRRIEKHRKTMNYAKSSIRSIDENSRIFYGEVMATYDLTHKVFIIRNGIVEVSDSLNLDNAKLSFTYDLKKGIYGGKGSKSNLSECEKYLCYVLALLQEYKEKA